MTKPSLDLRSISVVVPVFNSAETLPELASRIESALTESADSFELILVNDGSEDESWSVLVELARSHSWIVGIDLANNVGQLEATYCGARFARHSITVTMDDDLQYRPEEIPALVAPLALGYGLVYGRPERAQQGPLRRAGSASLRRVLRIMTGRRAMERSSSFRAFHTGLLNDVDDGTTALIDTYLLRATDQIQSQQVHHDVRGSGRSGYRLPDLIRLASRITAGIRGSRARAESDRYEVRCILNGAEPRRNASAALDS